MTHSPPSRDKNNPRVRLYWIWAAMLDRCRNPNCKGYKDYGIKVIGGD